MTISAVGVTKRFGDFRRARRRVARGRPAASSPPCSARAARGKSTLLRVIAGLERADAGEVIISGEDATGLPARERGVGFVFQHYAAFKHMTVRENVAFGLSIRRRPKAEIAARVDELLHLVQLGGLAERYPSQLSGGQRQRMALGAGAGGGAQGPAARRAVRRSRRARAQGAARVAAPPARRDARDDRLRHARPGGGDGGRRPHRHHERGSHRADRAAARALRDARQRIRDELPRPGQQARRRAGAAARRGAAARAQRRDHGGADRPHHVPGIRGPRGASSCSTAASSGRRRRASRRRRSSRAGRCTCAQGQPERSTATAPRRSPPATAPGGTGG